MLFSDKSDVSPVFALSLYFESASFTSKNHVIAIEMIVHIIGCFNQSSTLLYKNATVYYYDKEVLQTNMELADYTSQLGDSDSTIIHKASSVNSLVSLHTRRSCSYNFPTEGLDMIINAETKQRSGIFYSMGVC